MADVVWQDSFEVIADEDQILKLIGKHRRVNYQMPARKRLDKREFGDRIEIYDYLPHGGHILITIQETLQSVKLQLQAIQDDNPGRKAENAPELIPYANELVAAIKQRKWIPLSVSMTLNTTPEHFAGWYLRRMRQLTSFALEDSEGNTVRLQQLQVTDNWELVVMAEVFNEAGHRLPISWPTSQAEPFASPLFSVGIERLGPERIRVHVDRNCLANVQKTEVVHEMMIDAIRDAYPEARTEDTAEGQAEPETENESFHYLSEDDRKQIEIIREWLKVRGKDISQSQFFQKQDISKSTWRNWRLRWQGKYGLPDNLFDG